MDEVIKVSHLEKSFRKNGLSRQKVRVLKDLNFVVPKGKVTGFLVANVSVKTTTLKCLLGLAFPDSGEIRYFGEPELTEEIKMRIGFLPERPYFYEYLTGEEFLRFYGQLSRRYTRHELDQKIPKLLEKVGLQTAHDKALRNYSKGMLQRIGIAQALIHDPEFVILDEPMTGLDPDGRWEVTQIIQETASKGTSIFFSSHLLNDAEKICDHLVVLKEGQVLFNGPTSSFVMQMDSQFVVFYVDPRAPQDIRQMSVAREQLQECIDKLRTQKQDIIEIRKSQISLEQAFMRAAFGKERGL
jgi:ABC-2 type transport system ATP-binding protein